MANNYYDNTTNIILPATSAEAADVENKCDDIVAGFELVEEDIDKAISLSHADNTNRDIPDAVGVRANKMLGCDSTGAFGLQVRRGTFKGDWTAATYFYQDDLIKDTADALGEGVNSIFVATVNHTSSADLATDTANWALVLSASDFTTPAYVDAADALKADITYVDDNFLNLITWDYFFSGISGGLRCNRNLTMVSDTKYANLQIQPDLAGGTSSVILNGEGNPTVQAYFQLTDSTGNVQIIRRNAAGAYETILSLTDDGNVTVDGATPNADDHLTRRDFVTAADALKFDKTGGDLSGDVSVVQSDTSVATLSARNSAGGYSLYTDASGNLLLTQTTSGGGFEAIWMSVIRNGGFSFYHNGAKKLETHALGAVVTGKLEADSYSVGGAAGATGTFTTSDAKTVTVTNGIITSIV